MKRSTIFRILTLIYLIAVGVLCFANFSSIPTAPGSFLGIPADKIIHFLMFAPFPILSWFSLERKGWGVVRSMLVIVLVFAVGCMIAGATEIIQGHLPYRTMDPADFRADMLGLALSSVIAFLIDLYLSRSHA